MPKYILRIGYQEFAVPESKGAATLMTMMEDAIPVHSKFYDGEIELVHDDEPDVFAGATAVSIKRIPPGTVWKRKRKDGTVEVIRPVAVENSTGKKRTNGSRRLSGRAALQLEFGR